MQTVDHQLVELALQRVGGADFEKFSHAFFASLSGVTFVPLGGVHDGGADALEAGLFEEAGESRFWQASVEQTHRSKIRRTVERLRKFGRDPKQLTYCTSIIVPHIDREEDTLGEELGLRIRIRDQKYIVSQINYSPQAVQAFNSYLDPSLAFLRQIGGTTTSINVPDVASRSLCVFLGQEVDRRRGNTQLLEAVTDSLILWSLEGTDPDKGIFLTRDQILKRIEQALPSAKQFVRGVLDTRIEFLSSKDNPSRRQVRWHKKQGQFCLPHETRLLIIKENIEDECLKSDVSEVFRLRASDLLDDEDFESNIQEIVNICHRSLELAFEKQGLEIAYFMLGDEPEDYVSATISDHIKDAIDRLGITSGNREFMQDACLHILRHAFYDSSEQERIYLSKLSRTYTLLFILRNDPKIVEYFRRMSANFVLYIGADLIIRALSEFYLSPENRMTWNMFAILRAAGSSLVLTEIALQEIITHLRAADSEFRNFYMEIEPYMTLALARHIDRILIRSYFYARLGREGNIGRPAGWKTFIGQFCTYNFLHSDAGKDSLRRYLCEQFGFEYETEQDSLRGIDEGELDGLKDRIVGARRTRRDKEELLAYNDALQVLRTYERRKELNEARRPSAYGYRTWWLTNDVGVRRATGEVVQKKGALYMMRPEFILNFIAISPTSDEVRRSFDTVFPSLLGVKLSNRMRNDLFKDVVGRVKQAYEISDARVRALVGELSDQLKGDFYKAYESKLSQS